MEPTEIAWTDVQLTIIRSPAITTLETRLVYSRMIVCVCNRLSEARIRWAIAAGAQTPLEVYAGCGVERNCGRCQETIAEMLDEAAEQTLEQAA